MNTVVPVTVAVAAVTDQGYCACTESPHSCITFNMQTVVGISCIILRSASDADVAAGLDLSTKIAYQRAVAGTRCRTRHTAGAFNIDISGTGLHQRPVDNLDTITTVSAVTGNRDVTFCG